MTYKQCYRILLSFILFSMSANAFAYDAQASHPFSYYQQQYFSGTNKQVEDVNLPERQAAQKSYAARAKSYAKKLVKKGKSIASFLFDPLNQWHVLNISIWLAAIEQIKEVIKIKLSVGYSPLAKPYPPAIATACAQMHYEPSSISIANSGIFHYNAAAFSGGSLVIGQKLLDRYTENEISFVVGHEIAHIQKRHHLKKLGTYIGMIGCLVVLSIVMDKGIKKLERYCYYHNCHRLKKIIPILKYLQGSPLLYVALYGFTMSKISQMREKEADMTSALALNNAQAGASGFQKDIDYEKELMSNKSFSQKILQWLNPFYLARKTMHMVIDSHPSHQERIAYLSELAKQQAQ